jgi:hypothetical protein
VITKLRIVLFLSWFVCVALLAGCAKEDPLYRVFGTVNCNGKPVPKGNIYFDPDPMKGGKGTQGFADILDGKFDTKGVGGKGVQAGAYVIRVLGYDGKPANEAPYGQVLFNEYTEKKDFTAQDNELTFDIPGTKKK